MWPVEGGTASAAGTLPELDVRARKRLLVGAAGVLLALAVASVLSIRTGQSGSVPLSSTGAGAATLWISDGFNFNALTARGGGPRSNHADMAFDPNRGALVLWDHGCAHVVLGFTGGCSETVDQTWTWDGSAWSPRSPHAEPLESGPGAMAYDARLGGVVYANSAGQAWVWNGADWRGLAPQPPAALLREGVAAVGWHSGQGRLIWLTVESTWSWDGAAWTRLGAGIDAADARQDGAGLLEDPATGQLLYVGSSSTWTFEAGAWSRHPQPAFGAGSAAAFDARSGLVTLIAEDPQACDRASCRSELWTWDGTHWMREGAAGPSFPLSRSGEYPPPAAYDPVQRRLALFVSSA
ncbi:MAG TPA: hypothetical protein VF137_10640 [Candidatus Dormibacteraeota bacterium]